MLATRVSTAEGPTAARPSRRYAFFISTTGCVGDLKRHLGSADYSYGFVLKAVTPALERLGTWQLVARPESSLSHLASRAAAEGLRPIYLVLHPPHNAYFTPDVPTVLFPFWEFPRIPDRDFGFDTRQNWRRMCQGADLIVTACRFTAEAFRESGVTRPLEVVPVPLAAEAFDVPAWNPEHSWSIVCRHLVLGGDATPPVATGEATAPQGPRAAFWKRALRAGYRRYVRRWLNARTIERIKRVRRTVLRIPDEPLPLLPSTPLTLSGLVYTSLFNPSDRRKNARDILTAFLLAFRDRPDVTLVLKLATSASREFHDLHEFRAVYEDLGLTHRCRVVLLTDFLSDEQMASLFRSTTYYVNASRAEGACLPLQQALAAGRPSIAPRHTAMADYLDDSVGFVIGAHPEPTFWPHDPEQRTETYWNRLVWSDLRDAFLTSAEVAFAERSRYDAMAAAARSRMADFAACEVVAEGWRRALGRLEERGSQVA